MTGRQLTRRRAIALFGTTATLTGAAALAGPMTKPASAAITVDATDGLTIPDASADLADGDTVSAVPIEVKGRWQYRLADAPDVWQVQLRAGNDPSTIASVNGTTSAAEDSGTYRVTADLLDHPDYDADRFTPAAGKNAVVDIPVTVRLVLIRDARQVKTATASAKPTVTVDGPTVTVSANLGGEGSIAVKTA